MIQNITLEYLRSLRKEDEKTGANTYIAVLPKNKLGFIRDELCFVEAVGKDDFTFFRSMDGKRYTMTEDKLKYFKLVGRI